MRELSEDEGDLMAEQGRGVGKALGKSVYSWDSSGEVWGRGEVAKAEHGTVSEEQWRLGIEQGLLELFYCGNTFGHRRCGIYRSKVAVKVSIDSQDMS